MQNAKPAVRRLFSAGIAGHLVMFPCAAAHAQLHAYGMAAKGNGVGISNQTLELNLEGYSGGKG